MRLAGAIFDLDGTIADTSAICFATFRNALARVSGPPLTDDEILQYVASGEPLDKAGAYAIQGLACKFVQKIDGSYANVVGLPVALVYHYLRITTAGS